MKPILIALALSAAFGCVALPPSLPASSDPSSAKAQEAPVPTPSLTLAAPANDGAALQTRDAGGAGGAQPPHHHQGGEADGGRP